MIASLTGRIERAAPGEVVLVVGGVGYRVHVPLSTYGTLPPVGRECGLRVTTVVREDEISLYGFATSEEEELFGLLQGVSGVGPRLALKVLSGLSTPTLKRALVEEDHAALTAVPGVGRKLAQRLVLELRDKVGAGAVAAAQEVTDAADRLEEDGVAALEGLGYPRKQARSAVRKAREQGAEALEQLVRDALQVLAPRR